MNQFICGKEQTTMVYILLFWKCAMCVIHLNPRTSFWCSKITSSVYNMNQFICGKEQTAMVYILLFWKCAMCVTQLNQEQTSDAPFSST
jgi:G:T-mismatch repair DNA endonuclease (very short patch repair protein)